jgi:hypothetical protein
VHTTDSAGVERGLLVFAIALALVLRLALTFLNNDFNDDHLAVVDAIVSTGKIPSASVCFQCYHPKLFHVAVAAAVRALHIPSSEHNVLYRLPAQIIASLAGFVMLLAGRRFIWETTADRRIRTWALALLCCSAPLAGISVQATNDAFAILFASLALLLTAQLARIAPPAPLPLANVALLSGACILTALSKGSGLVIFAAIAALFVWRALTRAAQANELGPNLAALAILCVPFFAIVPLAGQYAETYRASGTPLALNVAKNAPPGLCTPVIPTEIGALDRPGVLSVCDGFFTFKLGEILRQPYINGAPNDTTGARTSLWTQLYARSYFLFFEQWPARWSGTQPQIVALGRATLSLALIPTAIALVGLGLGLASFATERRLAERVWSESGALVVPGVAMLAAFVALNYQYRDYGSMKAIYLFPVMFSAIWCFERGATWIRSALAARGARPAVAANAIGGSVVALCALSVAALGLLAWKLWANA